MKGEFIVAKILVISCAKTRDVNCIGCLKCFKASKEGAGEYAQHEDGAEIVAISGCGGCPGLVMPKTTLLMEIADYMEVDIDAVHLGTCMVAASKTGGCTLDLEKTAELIRNKFGKKVIIGTHNY